MPNEGKLSQLRRSSDNPGFFLSDFSIAAASCSQLQIRRASHYFNVQGLIIMLHKVFFNQLCIGGGTNAAKLRRNLLFQRINLSVNFWRKHLHLHLQASWLLTVSL